MVANFILEFIKNATKKTNAHNLDWNGLDEFWREEEFPDLVEQAEELIGVCEFTHLLWSNSFYCRHKDGVVALLRIRQESGRDGSSYYEYALACQIKKNSMVFFYNDDDIQEPCKTLYNAILDLFNEQVNLPEDLQNFLSF